MNSVRWHMKRIAYAAFVILWLCVAVIGLEAYTRWHQRQVEKTNPFVLAAKQSGALWQHTDLDENGQPVAKDSENAFAATPDSAPISDDDHLGTQLAAMNEADRELFATLREMVIAVYDTNGNNLALYGGPDIPGRLGVRKDDIAGKPFDASPLASEAKDGLELIQRVAKSGKPDATAFKVNLPQGETSFDMRAYPMKDASGAVKTVACALNNITGLPLTEALARQQDTSKNPMWKDPWFEYRKNAHLSDKWHTNNFGFRDRDIQLPKPPGLFRILCIGGSTTEEGLTNDATYPKFLEQALREAFPGRAIEAINCGVVGLDSLGERRRTLDYVQLEPDLVIEYNAVNDICHGLFPEWNNKLIGWRAYVARSAFLTSWANGLLCPNRAVIDAGMEQVTFRNLRIMAGVFKQRGIPVAFCSFAYPDTNRMTRAGYDYMEWNLRTTWQGVHFTFGTYCRLVDIYNAKLKTLCDEQGGLYLPFAEQFNGGIDLFGDITHMRPKGMALKAKAIVELLAPYLRERLK